MKTFLIVIGVFVVLGLLLGFTRYRDRVSNEVGDNQNNIPDTTSNGVIEWSRPADFGIAVTEEQLAAAQSYIPPCSEDFDYCLYYNGNDFEGTNFDSAGIRIKRRSDLSSSNSCLNTPPVGYANAFPSSTTTPNYSASIFSPLGNAGAGHYANGELYRVFVEGVCMEIETSIGESQYENYPKGEIEKFDESKRDVIYSKFNSILSSLKISSTKYPIRLPDSEN